MYLHLPTLGWLTRPGVLRGNLAWRRLAYTSGLSLAQLTLFLTVSSARALDPLLYRDLKQHPVPDPLFVTATPRSGTTFLHELLALDEERFLSFKLYQTVAPAVCIRRAAQRLEQLDRYLGSPAGRALAGLDRRLFRNWKGIHRVSLNAHEEDENLFVLPLVSPAIYLLFPALDALPEFIDVDAWPAQTTRRIAEAYQDSVRRLVYGDRPQRTPLIKNVLMASRMGITEAAFPNARFIHVLRNPLQAIPSAVSLFYAMWRVHSPEIAPNAPQTRALARMFIEHTRRLCEHRRRTSGRSVQVQYDQLVSNPVGTIEAIYDAFGWGLTPEFQRQLERKARAASGFRSQHRYDLAQFGLSEADIREALADYWSDWFTDTPPGGRATNGLAPWLEA